MKKNLILMLLMFGIFLIGITTLISAQTVTINTDPNNPQTKDFQVGRAEIKVINYIISHYRIEFYLNDSHLVTTTFSDYANGNNWDKIAESYLISNDLHGIPGIYAFPIRNGVVDDNGSSALVFLEGGDKLRVLSKTSTTANVRFIPSGATEKATVKKTEGAKSPSSAQKRTS